MTCGRSLAGLPRSMIFANIIHLPYRTKPPGFFSAGNVAWVQSSEGATYGTHYTHGTLELESFSERACSPLSKSDRGAKPELCTTVFLDPRPPEHLKIHIHASPRVWRRLRAAGTHRAINVRGGRAVRPPMHHVQLGRAEPSSAAPLRTSGRYPWRQSLNQARAHPAAAYPLLSPRRCGLCGFCGFRGSVVCNCSRKLESVWSLEIRTSAVCPPGSILPSIAVLAMMALRVARPPERGERRTRRNVSRYSLAADVCYGVLPDAASVLFCASFSMRHRA